MNSRHLVDPELVPILDALPAVSLNADTLPQARLASAGLNGQAAEPLEWADISVTNRQVPGPAGAPDVQLVIYTPKNFSSPLPAFYWLHGGGYVMGTAEAAGPVLKEIVSKIGCIAVAVDYRVAPETPHPGPVEDAYAGLKWLYANATDLQLDPERIAIGGGSAGGGLAATLGLLVRDRGEIPVVFQLLIYPMLDDRTVTHADPHPYTGEYVWTRESNRFGWTSLLGGEPGGPDVSPYAAAARAENLAGLPPTFISVGTLDLFLEEDLEYARRLIRGGVPTELHVYPGAFHGFMMATQAQVTQAYNRNYLNALDRAFKQY